MSVASEQPHAAEQPAAEPAPATAQPVLLRLVEPGPPPEPSDPSDPPGQQEQPRPPRQPGQIEHAGPVGAWRSPVLSGLPDLRPASTAPVQVARRATARATTVVITEAEARGLAGAMARAVLEALEGRRPVHQLNTLFSERAVATVQTLRRGGLRWPIRRATVTGVRVFLPSRAAVEACVTFSSAGRIRVLALRIDRERRRWVGTSVRVG